MTLSIWEVSCSVVHSGFRNRIVPLFTQVQEKNNVVSDSMVLVFARHWTPGYDPYHIEYASTHTRDDRSLAHELSQGGTYWLPRGSLNRASPIFGLESISRHGKQDFSGFRAGTSVWSWTNVAVLSPRGPCIELRWDRLVLHFEVVPFR
jgi:hypothetical protein